MLKKNENLSLIHFDTLWETMSTVLAERADAEWQHHGDSDPGVAMLQALAFGGSDVAYRHLHTLEDLFTSEAAPPGDETAKDITREEALTTTPVSADDYRRLILDMVEKYDGDDNSLYHPCKNVVVAPDADGDRLCVWLLPEMIISERLTSRYENQQKKRLIYRVETLLSANRSHGERLPRVNLIEPRNVTVKLEVDLIDCNVNIAKVFARLYDLLDDWISPRAKRCFDTNKRDAWLACHGGPETEYGFIEILPQIDLIQDGQDFNQNLEILIEKIKSIEGVRGIYDIALQPDRSNKNLVDKNTSFFLCKDNFGGTIRANPVNSENYVEWCGIKIRLQSDAPKIQAVDIHKEILLLRAPQRFTNSVKDTRSKAITKYRNVKEWADETWKRLPPSLALNGRPVAAQDTDLLRQFLSAFDGHLKHLCDRLDKLKLRLRFVSDNGLGVSGNSQLGTVSIPSGESAVLKDEELRDDVFDVGYIQAHLLQYFGFGPTELSKTRYGFYRSGAVTQTNRFIESIADIARKRLAAKGPITALQKEIAYSLGLYSSAFFADDHSHWPFYMLDISHLIPKAISLQDGVIIIENGKQIFGKISGKVLEENIHEMAIGAIVDVHKGTFSSTLSAYPGIITGVDHGQSTVTVKLFGEPTTWDDVSTQRTVPQNQFILRPHHGDSAYFPLRDLAKPEGGGKMHWKAHVAFGGVYPWLHENLKVKVHVLDSDCTESQGGSATGEVTLLNANADSVVDFTLPESFKETSKHRLFVSVPGLYDQRAAAGQRLAFVFPLYRDVENANFKAWQAKVNFQLKRLVPSHLEFEVYWLKEETYSAFARKFHDWQNRFDEQRGMPGPGAIPILESLGLARVALPLKGIGTLHIKKEGERADNAREALEKWIFHVND
ncbi:hypothetical protein [Robbsia andropogonis]|uniref:hypothetical protein n=1 Tax=Robbsia andropogonis TaxID=28092 RepID=UPI002A6B47EC|nr:hypothetical protein [Robbsia andropogonis]